MTRLRKSASVNGSRLAGKIDKRKLSTSQIRISAVRRAVK
jgi:hypothetical protein